MGETRLSLVAFALVVALNLFGLALDAVLLVLNHKTVTQRVWNRWWLGIPILALQFIGALALLIHFWGVPWRWIKRD